MPAIYATITVDWDGVNLDQNNLHWMRMFNRFFPGVPITHFICPAYLTRTILAAERVLLAAEINSVIKNIDEVSLHIHCWYSLLAEAQVPSVATPTFYHNDEIGPTAPWGALPNGDAGHGVPLGYYSAPQIGQILQTGKRLLQGNQITNANADNAFLSFRCGGWLAGDKVLRAVRREGYLYEASGAPALYFSNIVWREPESRKLAEWVSSMWGCYQVPLPTYLENTWQQQFYPAGIAGLYPQSVATTPSNPKAMNGLLQVPDTGALADYVDETSLQTYIDAARAEVQAGRDAFISMGWHEDSASWESPFHPGIANLQVIINTLANNNNLHFLTVSESIQQWLALHTQAAPPLPPRLPFVVPEKLPAIPVTKRGLILG